MKIGVIGTGDVGRVLSTGWLAEGNDVMIGSRDPSQDKVQAIVGKNPGLEAGTFAETAKFGEVVVLATLWSGTEHALQLAGRENFAGKVVIDATNPLLFEPNRPPRLALGHTDSGGEQVQRWLPDARVVKAFNTVGNAFMVHPDFPGGPPDMFIAGNDADAKKTVSELAGQLGWPGIVDGGGIDGARELEPMCILWVKAGIFSGKWNHAFKLLRK